MYCSVEQSGSPLFNRVLHSSMQRHVISLCRQVDLQANLYLEVLMVLTCFCVGKIQMNNTWEKGLPIIATVILFAKVAHKKAMI